ncbi:Thiol-disulfide oxidoreductase ResA [Austwickia sp. TVS 96-490-7B]|uniref:TlpA family protein disulfide reductase n=1 Tax=Austwickia sp. TVS 96-490-7B TaxID=2830843 RepID=UPI001C57335E|nr:TlpA disulfide reductase family protein [Austwickia sp. TVS 96-490-7B]MBW3084819.1 Thiol-disulfide oxidoreductase ResA [Austwickia sp. TVS 96-490-7B]
MSTASSSDTIDNDVDPTPLAHDWRSRLRANRWGTPLVLVVTLVLVLGGVHLVRGAEGDAAAPHEAAGMGKVSAVDLKGGATGPAPAVGSAAPGFTAKGVDGAEVTLAQFAGRPVWLTFGASWCASCRAEFPDIQAVHEAAGEDGVAVVGVYLSEGAPAVQEYVKRLGLTYTHIPDPQTRIASAYRVMGVPAHVFIDKKGVVQAIDTGIVSRDQVRERLARIGG